MKRISVSIHWLITCILVALLVGIVTGILLAEKEQTLDLKAEVIEEQKEETRTISVVFVGSIIEQDGTRLDKPKSAQYMTTFIGVKKTSIIIGKQSKELKEEGSWLFSDYDLWLNASIGDEVIIIWDKDKGQISMWSRIENINAP